MGLLFALALSTGCELEARPMGTQLAQGRDIYDPAIVWAAERPLVLFDRTVGVETDMHAIPFGGDGAEMIWNQMSTRYTWMTGSGYLLAEQVLSLSLFTLQSTSPVQTVMGTIDGLQGDELLFHQGGGLSSAAFFTHLPSGRLWQLGSLAQAWLAPDGRLYYLGNTGIFRSLNASDSAPEAADRLATSFMVSPDQRHAVVRERSDPSSSLASGIRDRLLMLPSLREKATLPLGDRECSWCDTWLGFSPDSRSFYYAENYRSEASVIYQLDAEALEVQSAPTRPGPLATALLWSPDGTMGLLGEQPCSAREDGCRVLHRSIVRPGPSFEPLSSAVVAPRFSPDGRYLLFEDALSEGRLWVARTDALSPEPTASATVLSPEGSVLDGATFDQESNTVLFWARPLGGKSSVKIVHSAERSDLYAAAAPDFAVRRLAESVDAVAIGRGHALALVRFSPQDLTGDLVLYDLRSGRAHNLASPVSAFWASMDCPTAVSPPLRFKWQGTFTRSTEIAQGCPESSSLLLTFVVRGRVKSSKDGLWSLRVPQ